MNILVIAPHPDDEVLGVGGTIAKRTAMGDQVDVCIVTKGRPQLFNPSVVKQGREEAKWAANVLGVRSIIFLDFPAAELDTVSHNELVSALAEVIQTEKPDEVFIPHQGDLHIDHKLVAEAAMVAVRPKYRHKVKRVYAYECPSETEWDIPSAQNAFMPNVYEDITDTISIKIKALSNYQSQIDEFPATRSLEAVNALATYRGATVYTRAAEAFSLIREIR